MTLIGEPMKSRTPVRLFCQASTGGGDGPAHLYSGIPDAFGKGNLQGKMTSCML